MTKNEIIRYVKQFRESLCYSFENIENLVDATDENEKEIRGMYYDKDHGLRWGFIEFDRELEAFIGRLDEKEDLPAGELVMCKAHESELDGWRIQQYWQKGQTKSDMESEIVHSGWLYIVPLKYFKPTSTDWRPAESYNWAKFGKE